MNRMPLRLAAIFLVGVLASLGVAQVTVGNLPASSATAAHGASAPRGDRIYVYPQDQRDAAAACYRTQREMREIPGDSAGYRAWYAANAHTELGADWAAAHERCRVGNYQRPFDWAHLVLVRTEPYKP